MEKFSNVCKCGEKAMQVIMDADMTKKMNVCDDCMYQELSIAAGEGYTYFYKWALAVYNDEAKATRIANIIFDMDAEAEGEEVDMEGTMWMFTYGILKYPHNLRREGALEIVENSTISGQTIHLYSNSFPVTKKTGNAEDLVYGTLFEIPKRVILTHYDHVEGYRPSRPAEQNMYNREVVQVTKPNGEVVEAEMYFANQRQFARDLTAYTHIPTGNFDDRHLARSYRPPTTYRGKNKKSKSK